MVKEHIHTHTPLGAPPLTYYVTNARHRTLSHTGAGRSGKHARQFRAQKSYSYEMPGFTDEIVAAARAEMLGHRPSGQSPHQATVAPPTSGSSRRSDTSSASSSASASTSKQQTDYDIIRHRRKQFVQQKSRSCDVPEVSSRSRPHASARHAHSVLTTPLEMLFSRVVFSISELLYSELHCIKYTHVR